MAAINVERLRAPSIKFTGNDTSPRPGDSSHYGLRTSTSRVILPKSIAISHNHLVLPGIATVRSKTNRSEPFLLSRKGSPIQQPAPSTLTSTTPRKRKQDAVYSFAHTTTSATSRQESGRPGAPVENSGFRMVLENSNPFTATWVSRECFLPLPEQEKMIETNLPGNISQASVKKQAIATTQASPFRNNEIASDVPMNHKQGRLKRLSSQQTTKNMEKSRT